MMMDLGKAVREKDVANDDDDWVRCMDEWVSGWGDWRRKDGSFGKCAGKANEIRRRKRLCMLLRCVSHTGGWWCARRILWEKFWDIYSWGNVIYVCMLFLVRKREREGAVTFPFFVDKIKWNWLFVGEIFIFELWFNLLCLMDGMYEMFYRYFAVFMRIRKKLKLLLFISITFFSVFCFLFSLLLFIFLKCFNIINIIKT